MKYATKKRNQNDSFSNSMYYFDNNFPSIYLNDYMDGEEFLHDFGTYLDNTKFPCDKIILNPFYGYTNEFAITFKYNNEEICWYLFNISECTSIIKIENNTYKDKTIEKLFKNIIKDFINDYNNNIFNNALKQNNITNINDIIEIIVNNYKDYNNTQQKIALKGTINQIFEQYTTHNDRLKYCNGTYWKFETDNFNTLYTIFIQNYNGNYFLDNAVKRGVIID